MDSAVGAHLDARIERLSKEAPKGAKVTVE
jgi:hypothetical protein